MYDITLRYTGEATYQPSEFDQLKSAIDALSQSHTADNPITVPGGSFRWRGGALQVRVKLEVRTTTEAVDADEQRLADAVVAAGVASDAGTVKDDIQVR